MRSVKSITGLLTLGMVIWGASSCAPSEKGFKIKLQPKDFKGWKVTDNQHPEKSYTVRMEAGVWKLILPEDTSKKYVASPDYVRRTITHLATLTEAGAAALAEGDTTSMENRGLKPAQYTIEILTQNGKLAPLYIGKETFTDKETKVAYFAQYESANGPIGLIKLPLVGSLIAEVEKMRNKDLITRDPSTIKKIIVTQSGADPSTIDIAGNAYLVNGKVANLKVITDLFDGIIQAGKHEITEPTHIGADYALILQTTDGKEITIKAHRKDSQEFVLSSTDNPGTYLKIGPEEIAKLFPKPEAFFR